jgi:hypothetical protein
LWIMVCYAEKVIVNHDELCRASSCESWCIMVSQWLWILVGYSEAVVVNHCLLCEAPWLRIMMYYAEQSGCESLYAMLSPVVGNHGVLCQTSGSESWFVMLGQWLWIMVYYTEPLLCIMVYHAELVSFNHGELWWTSGYESWCAMLSQWL